MTQFIEFFNLDVKFWIFDIGSSAKNKEPCGPYSLTSSAIQSALSVKAEGGTSGTIQKILGHEKRKTTEICLYSFNETEKQAIRDYRAAKEKSHTEYHTTKKALNSQVS